MSVASEAGVLNDRYEVGDVIGRGGMGEVRRAFDRRLHRDVAIKFLRPDLAAQRTAHQRFATEARSAARLTHPNVVLVLDVGEHDGQPYLVMECLPGESLHDEVKGGPMTERTVRSIARDVLAGLGAAHELGILHRDITPSNILLTEDGHAKIADFGIAKTTDGLDQTVVGQVLGTPAYLAPERLRGDAATTAADIYAVGVVLYEALTGARAFQADTPVATAHAVVSTAPPSLSDLRPGVDPNLVGAIEAAMDKDPANRPASAEAMLAQLKTTAPATTAEFAVIDPSPQTVMMDAVPAAATVMVDAVPAVGRAPRRPVDRLMGLTSNAWIALGTILATAVLLFAFATRGGGGDPASANTPSTSAPVVTTVPPTSPPTTIAVRVVAPVEKGKGGGKHGKGDND